MRRGNINKKLPITDPKLGARTIMKIFQISTQLASGRKFNVSRAPLFPAIPLHNTVIDNLHLFLRVSDVLINHLIEELRRQDATDKKKQQKKKCFTTFTLCKYRDTLKLIKFCEGLGIPNYKFLDWKNLQAAEVANLNWRTLTGPEKLKL